MLQKVRWVRDEHDWADRRPNGIPAHGIPQRTTDRAVAARKGIPVSVSVRSVEEVRDALKKGARLASVGTLETVLYQALRGWL